MNRPRGNIQKIISIVSLNQWSIIRSFTQKSEHNRNSWGFICD